MRLDKGKNTKRGIVYGVLNKFVTLLLPFLIQTIMIKTLGVGYAGVKGLYSSILSVLSLTELGIGSAIVYSMYKPIAEDDIETIGALLNLYKRLYKLVGVAVLVIGLGVTPFLKHLIKGEYPEDINLYVVFLLYLANTVISYWMYAYKSSLLSAYQRTDVISNAGTVTHALMCLTQIIILLVTKNFYLYFGISIVFTILNNLIISSCVDRMYPEIKCRGKVSEEMMKGIKTNLVGLVIDKVCGATRNTFDNIFMTMFLGLTLATIYSNYLFVLAALNGFTSIILTSLLAGIGNSIALESKENNFKQMMTLNTIYLLIGGWMTTCMLCLYQPFMTIWMGNELQFPDYIMILFPIYFYIQKMGDIRSVYSDAAGLFWENRWRTLIEAVANIVLNYVFVVKWGAFGIVLATILTMFFISFIGSTIVIFKHYFVKGMKEFLLSHGVYAVATLITAAATFNVCGLIHIESPWITCFVRGAVCCTMAPLLLVILVCWRKDFKMSVKWVLGRFRRNYEK